MKLATSQALKEAYSTPIDGMVALLANAAAGLTPPLTPDRVGSIVMRISDFKAAMAAAIETETFAQANDISAFAAKDILERSVAQEYLDAGKAQGIIPEEVSLTGNPEEDKFTLMTLQFYISLGAVQLDADSDGITPAAYAPTTPGLTEEETAEIVANNAAADAEYQRRQAAEQPAEEPVEGSFERFLERISG